jgi:peptidoglycan/LPS O-acetylase OafA/YrhL
MRVSKWITPWGTMVAEMTTHESHLSHPKYRPDIDGLRAVAVLSVVAFHAFPAWMKGGFIGVDVFFVISGFLITTIIFENLDRGTFSFTEFYARRIKRIFPALLIVIVASFAFGWFLLLADEYKQLGKHIAAGAGFTSNFVLWGEAGYFDNSAETKPLLHLWSLAIEEQFYIVWPFILWFAWKRNFNIITITIIVAIVSFYLNIKGVKKDAVATFYSPQTRFWELLAGSILAWFSLYKKDAFAKYNLKIDGWFANLIHREAVELDGKTLSNFISVVGSLLLAYGFWRITKDVIFPGNWAVIPVLGAVLIIMAGPKAWINRNVLSNKIAVWFGLISFPLYMWHWPLLSFARIIDGEVPSRNIRIAAVCLSIVLAWLTYKLVERPIRFGGKTKPKVTVLVILIFAIGFVGYHTYVRDGLTFRTINNQSSKIIRLTEDEPKAHKECLKFYSLDTENIRYCRLSGSAKPKIAIIGDSHGAALFTGLSSQLKNHSNQDLLMIGGRLFVDVAVYPEGSQFEIDVYKGGIKATRFVAENNSIDTVIMVSRGPALISPENYTSTKMNFYLLDDPSIHSRIKVFEIGMRRTLDLLLSRNKRIIFVLENPTLEFDPASCQLNRPFSLSDKSACLIKFEKFMEEHKVYRDLSFSVLRDYPSVIVFDSAKYLCDGENCFGKINNRILYGDRNHLSEDGSIYLSQFLVPYIEKLRR